MLQCSKQSIHSSTREKYHTSTLHPFLPVSLNLDFLLPFFFSNKCLLISIPIPLLPFTSLCCYHCSFSIHILLAPDFFYQNILLWGIPEISKHYHRRLPAGSFLLLHLRANSSRAETTIFSPGLPLCENHIKFKSSSF